MGSLNKRWTYYPTTYSGTIAKGTDAITIKGPYGVTPTSRSYITFSEFTSSTSDTKIAVAPATGTFLTSLKHLFIYKETGVRLIGTYLYNLSTKGDIDVYLSTSSGSGSVNIQNSSGTSVGSISFALGASIRSGITWTKNSLSSSSMIVSATITDVQVNVFDASNPYPVKITAGTSRMTLTNKETVSQYITYTGGVFSTSSADYNWAPVTYNCTTLASGGTDSWGATDVDDSASEDSEIDYESSDAGWEVWNAYFNEPYTDQMDNYG